MLPFALLTTALTTGATSSTRSELPVAVLSAGVVAGYGGPATDSDTMNPIGVSMGLRAGLQVGPVAYQRSALWIGLRYSHNFGTRKSREWGSTDAQSSLLGPEIGAELDVRPLLMRVYLWMGNAWLSQSLTCNVLFVQGIPCNSWSSSSARAFGGLGLFIGYQAPVVARSLRVGIDITSIQTSWWSTDYDNRGPSWGGTTAGLAADVTF
jgi:hypothetical protein